MPVSMLRGNHRRPNRVPKCAPKMVLSRRACEVITGELRGPGYSRIVLTRARKSVAAKRPRVAETGGDTRFSSVAFLTRSTQLAKPRPVRAAGRAGFFRTGKHPLNAMWLYRVNLRLVSAWGGSVPPRFFWP